MTEIAVDNDNVDLAALLRSGSFADLLAVIDEQQNVTTEPRSTIADRQKELAEALTKDLTGEKLIQMQEVLSEYVDQLAKDIVSFDGNGAELTHEQLVYLMRRHTDTKAIEELIKVVYGGLKRIIFEAITAKVARENPAEKFPEYVSDSIDIPEFGKRFCREGAGRMTPLIDQDELRRQLGEQLWERCCETVEVPAHTETKFSEVLLKAEILRDLTLMPKLTASLIPAGWKAGSYTTKPIKAKK